MLREKIRLRGNREGVRQRIRHVRNLSEQPKVMQDIFRQRVKLLQSNQQLGREDEFSEHKQSDSNSNPKNSDRQTPRPLDGPDSLKSYKLNNVYRLQCSPDRLSQEICTSIQDLNIYNHKEGKSAGQRRLSSPKFVGFEDTSSRKQIGLFTQFPPPVAEEKGEVAESSNNFSSKQETTHNETSNRQLETTPQLSQISQNSYRPQSEGFLPVELEAALPQIIKAFTRRRVHHWEKRPKAEEQIVLGRAKLKLSKAWEAHLDAVRFGAFVSPEQIITAGEDALVKLWNFEEKGGKFKVQLKHSARGHLTPICSAFLNRDSFFTGSFDGEVVCWKISAERCIAERKFSCGTEPIWDIASSGGDQLVSSSPNAVRFWDLVSPSLKPSASIVKSKNLFGKISFLNEKLLAVHCFSTKTLKNSLLLYDVSRPESVVQTIELGARSVNALTCAQNMSALICANEDRTISMIDWREGLYRVPMLAHAEAVTCCSYNAQSNLLISAGLDSSLRLWDMRNWPARCLDEFSKVEKKFDEPISDVRFSDNGQNVISSCSDSSVLVFRV